MSTLTTNPFCRCVGEHCGHHTPFERCPNEAVPPIATAIDMKTGTPMAGSASGLCTECWEQHLADRETESA